MANFDFNANPHVRLNPLTQEWVLVSPHRTQRPWLGQIENTQQASALRYDPACYMCPGNERANGQKNPDYNDQFVFNNDFPAVYSPLQEVHFDEGLLHARSESGVCRVVCYSPRHDLTFSRLGLPVIRALVDTWADEYQQLGGLPHVQHVQIFENSGSLMGASNPHPHGQIWATSTIPNEPATEQKSLLEYSRAQSRCLLCDYAEQEEKLGVRLVYRNDSFIAVVPFWAVWPYETLVLARRHVGSLDQLSPVERSDLSAVLQQVTTRYDNIFSVPFPYSMGFHQTPTDKREHPEWHLHAHYYPPLLRSATVRKFMVGFEMLGSPQRDLTPEQAAETLRGVSGVA